MSNIPLSRLGVALCEGVLPAVHLDDLDAVDDLVHDADPLVSQGRRLAPEVREHSAYPTLNREIQCDCK